ncbi:MAG: SDR family oxidoreductase [Niabella sp.]
MINLKGKTIIVTAAAQGIGKATVDALTKHGAHVIAVDINADALKNAQAAETYVFNVTDKEQVDAFAQSLDHIDVLFNCVGFVHHGTILDCNEDSWQSSININMNSMYYLCRAVLPKMIKAGRGNIINMSSVASSIIAAPNRFVYGTTKAAIIGLTKSIAADFIKDNIRCNAICPGTVKSPSLEQRMRAQGNYKTTRKAFIDRQPIGRIGKPEEIAALVCYLASDVSAYVTGQHFVIDGGWSNV